MCFMASNKVGFISCAFTTYANIQRSKVCTGEAPYILVRWGFSASTANLQTAVGSKVTI